MKEQLEKLHDEALLAQFQLDKQLKITMALTMVIQRQLSVLAKKTNTPVEEMDRNFILTNLAGVEVTSKDTENAATVVKRVLEAKT